MTAGCDQLGDGVGECGVWIHVEDRDGVSAFFHASFGEDDGDEVHASGLQERHGRG